MEFLALVTEADSSVHVLARLAPRRVGAIPSGLVQYPPVGNRAPFALAGIQSRLDRSRTSFTAVTSITGFWEAPDFEGALFAAVTRAASWTDADRNELFHRTTETFGFGRFEQRVESVLKDFQLQ